MNRRSAFLSIAVALCIAVLTACSILSPETSFAPSHPEELGAGRPSCSSCHENEAMKGGFKTYASFDHTDAFLKDHRFLANQDSGTCASCHSASSCADCHGAKNVMKPSTKMANRPDLASPHRGGFLTLHRMEGRIDPAGCYKCHGRANNDKCIACHK